MPHFAATVKEDRTLELPIEARTLLQPGQVIDIDVPESKPSVPAGVLIRRPGQAAAYMLARLADEATDDPEEIRQAQEDLDEMKATLNAERIRSGAQPIF